MAVQRGWFRKRLVLTTVVASITIFSFLILSSCGDASSNSSTAISSPHKDPIDPTVVKSLYNAKCGICHGSDGAMNYAGAKDLSISALPRSEVIGQVTYGKGTMPPMKGQLTDEQIEAVSDYCISLRVK